jgi:hypothetical protein
VVYNPRNIGNDMGLWIVGTAWIELVREIMPAITKNPKTGIDWLVAG